jgi:hypothetical protein
MKNISIKKSNYFSKMSKVYVLVGSKKVLIKGFELYTIPINEGEKISASQLWTGSKKIDFDKIEEGISYVIKPKLNKLLALIIGIVFIFCAILFILTRYRWSGVPLIPFAIYIIMYLTVFKERYLIIEKD